MSVTAQGFYFDPNEERYLNMDQTATNSIVTETGSVQAASEFGVSFTQFRPAIQIRTLFKKILGQAGFSYTSDFIDDSYFGKIFMTTANYLESAVTPTVNSSANPSGVMSVGYDAQWGNLGIDSTYCDTYGTDFFTVAPIIAVANTTAPSGDCTQFGDENNIWNSTYNYFTRTALTQETITISHAYNFVNITGYNNTIRIHYKLKGWNTTTNQDNGEQYGDGGYVDIPMNGYTTAGSQTNFPAATITLPIDLMSVGDSARIEISLDPVRLILASGVFCDTLVNNYLGYTTLGCDDYSKIEMNWFGFSDDIFDSTVDIPACIDPELTQRGFLKDIIQRFNLVVLTDPNNASNLLIEPYNDFIGSGELKNWTEIYNWLYGLGYPENLEQSAEVSKPSLMKPLGTKYSDATLLVLTSNKNVQHRVVFQNIFPVTLSQILMDSSVAEVEYITADVTFAYTIYNIERMIGER